MVGKEEKSDEKSLQGKREELWGLTQTRIRVHFSFGGTLLAFFSFYTVLFSHHLVNTVRI
jgi:hypothetical protein